MLTRLKTVPELNRVSFVEKPKKEKLPKFAKLTRSKTANESDLQLNLYDKKMLDDVSDTQENESFRAQNFPARKSKNVGIVRGAGIHTLNIGNTASNLESKHEELPRLTSSDMPKVLRSRPHKKENPLPSIQPVKLVT